MCACMCMHVQVRVYNVCITCACMCVCVCVKWVSVCTFKWRRQGSTVESNLAACVCACTQRRQV